MSNIGNKPLKSVHQKLLQISSSGDIANVTGSVIGLNITPSGLNVVGRISASGDIKADGDLIVGGAMGFSALSASVDLVVGTLGSSFVSMSNGNNVKIYPSCQIYSPWNLEIDDYGCLGREVDCLNYVKIKIGKNSTVSKRSFLCTGSRDYQKENKPIVVADIKIGNNCWVAAECFVSPGITVEDNSILLARSFLTKDFGPDSLIAGHPAKKIRNLN